MYKVKEINLMPNSKSSLAANEKTYSSDYLMKVGVKASRLPSPNAAP